MTAGQGYEPYPFYQRVGESVRDAQERVGARARGRRRHVDRVAASLEREGRPDLAGAVKRATDSSSILPGVQFVTVQLTCGARHAGDHRAAAVNVDTYARFGTFEEAWGQDGQGPGTWQAGPDVDRTTTVVVGDGHSKLEARCRTCERPVQINMQRLAAFLRAMWAPGATTRQSWSDSGTRL